METTAAMPAPVFQAITKKLICMKGATSFECKKGEVPTHGTTKDTKVTIPQSTYKRMQQY